MDSHHPPPPPPPHGSNSSSTNNNANGSRSSNLPPGNYDIFVIPPHSSGSGFLYLPSLQTHRNSFLAGAVCTLAVVGVWLVVMPVLKQWAYTVLASGGMGMLLLILGVGVLGWAYGKTQVESSHTGSGRSNPNNGANQQQNQSPPGGFNFGSSSFAGGAAGGGPKPSWQKANATPGSEAWSRAREEMRKKQEEQRKKDEDAKKAKTASELLKAAREREAREKAERLRKEKEAREKDQKGKPEKATSSPKYQKPTAHSLHGDEDAYSYRPYDSPKKPAKQASQSSMYSETSWTGTHSTARTTPPPSNRGPYTNKDPDKITIKAVYRFTNLFSKPQSQLVSGVGSVTDGLILRITTEGLFIDDDVRGVGQREWDVKAWTMKLVEVWCPSFAAQSAPAQPARYIKKQLNERFFGHEGFNKAPLTPEEIDAVLGDLGQICKGHLYASNSNSSKSGDFKGKHVLRATIRDDAQSKYVFIIDETEAWKVAVGLQRLRRSPLVRSLQASGMPANETKMVLSNLGWA